MIDVIVSTPDEDGIPRFSAGEITGIIISIMFAGHHTSSGTSAWTMIELLRHPEALAAVQAELDELDAGGGEGSFHGLRQVPNLEHVLRETRRVRPRLRVLR